MTNAETLYSSYITKYLYFKALDDVAAQTCSLNEDSASAFRHIPLQFLISSTPLSLPVLSPALLNKRYSLNIYISVLRRHLSVFHVKRFITSRCF